MNLIQLFNYVKRQKFKHEMHRNSCLKTKPSSLYQKIKTKSRFPKYKKPRETEITVQTIQIRNL